MQKLLKRIMDMVTDGDDHLEILRTYEFLKDLENLTNRISNETQTDPLRNLV